MLIATARDAVTDRVQRTAQVQVANLGPDLAAREQGLAARLRIGPDAVELAIAECAPSMRGASVTARTKTAKLETGLELQVPEYMEQGERVRVDTRTGEFIQRVQ